jgi:hypothetical protein
MLRRLTHKEMLTRLQVIQTLNPLVNRAFEISEQKRFEDQEGDNPHGRPWHVSFHASSFPGDDPKACPRQALYTMMDLPKSAFSRRSRMLMNIGKQVELDIVRAFADAGTFSVPILMMKSRRDSQRRTNGSLALWTA